MSLGALFTQERLAIVIETQLCENEDKSFGKFRRKVRPAEVLFRGDAVALADNSFHGACEHGRRKTAMFSLWVRGKALPAIGIATDGKLMVKARFLTK
jgi:hypothetical protein